MEARIITDIVGPKKLETGLRTKTVLGVFIHYFGGLALLGFQLLGFYYTTS